MLGCPRRREWLQPCLSLSAAVGCLCISTPSPKLASPTGKATRAQASTPRSTKPASRGLRALTTRVQGPKKNTRLTTPLLKPRVELPGDLPAWDNHAAPALRRAYKMMLFARLPLPALPFQRVRSPSSRLPNHSSSAECALPWSLTPATNRSASAGKEKLQSQRHKTLRRPAFPRRSHL